MLFDFETEMPSAFTKSIAGNNGAVRTYPRLAWNRLRQWNADRHDMTEIRKLDDQTLKDIGLNRPLIEFAIWHDLSSVEHS